MTFPTKAAALPHCCHMRNDTDPNKRDMTGPSKMTAIITGAAGSIAYWESASRPMAQRAFGTDGSFQQTSQTRFASLSAFAANSNHAPSHLDWADSWDAGVDFLFRIAGAR
ncbi:hypothetical protein NBRC116593_29550 [Sulfitobacter pacificus]